MKTCVGRAYTPYRPKHVTGQVGRDRVGQVVALGVGGDVGVVDLLDADPDHVQALAAVRLVHRPQGRRLRLARPAPARPEVDPDAVAAMIGQADRLAGHVEELPALAAGIDAGQLRGERARPQTDGRRVRSGRRSPPGSTWAGGSIEPSGVVTATRTTAAITTTSTSETTCRALNGPIRPRFGGRCSKLGRFAATGPTRPARLPGPRPRTRSSDAA